MNEISWCNARERPRVLPHLHFHSILHPILFAKISCLGHASTEAESAIFEGTGGPAARLHTTHVSSSRAYRHRSTTDKEWRQKAQHCRCIHSPVPKSSKFPHHFLSQKKKKKIVFVIIANHTSTAQNRSPLCRSQLTRQTAFMMTFFVCYSCILTVKHRL